jgi:hypothetical protein
MIELLSMKRAFAGQAGTVTRDALKLVSVRSFAALYDVRIEPMVLSANSEEN